MTTPPHSNERYSPHEKAFSINIESVEPGPETLTDSIEIVESNRAVLVNTIDSDDSGSINIINALVFEDHQHEIKLRTMTWQKAAWLLAGEQVCLAIMGQSWALSVLGWIPGIATMVVAGILFYVTSLTMHAFIMKHPQIKDICDFGYYAFGKSQMAYNFTAFMLLANNIILIGFHVLTGAQIFNTLTDRSMCTVVFSIVTMIIGIVLSLPRTLYHVSFMSMFSAACMGLAILLFLVFAGIEKNPAYGLKGPWPDAGTKIKTYTFQPPGNTWRENVTAVLTIVFLWVPQILFPSFIAEMERPQDFPKSLAVLAGISAFLFIVPPAIGYSRLGQYTIAPAFRSLNQVYEKASYSFAIVPTLIIGVIYANVSAKFVFFQIMGRSKHAHSNTYIGWGVWGAVIAIIWIVAFIFAEIIPNMEGFTALLSAVFDSFFGFIFFAVAYWQLNKGRLFRDTSTSVLSIVHVVVMICGLFLLGPGFYATVRAILDDYSGPKWSAFEAFSCQDPLKKQIIRS